MFTGIVTHRGRVESIDATDVGVTLRVRPAPPMEDVRIGDSVALDGVCLTVTTIEDALLSFDAVPETLRRTTLGDRAAGDVINMERALRMGDALGGHWVQGHVDGTGEIVSVERADDEVRFVVAVGEPLLAGLLPKGSVTLDGVSLTVGEVWREDAAEAPGRFRVYLIPHTLEVTGFGSRGVGERVNVEVDVLGRWVEHHLGRLQAGRPGS
jgi:riboflavin synthase